MNDKAQNIIALLPRKIRVSEKATSNFAVVRQIGLSLYMQNERRWIKFAEHNHE